MGGGTPAAACCAICMLRLRELHGSDARQHFTLNLFIFIFIFIFILFVGGLTYLGNMPPSAALLQILRRSSGGGGPRHYRVLSFEEQTDFLSIVSVRISRLSVSNLSRTERWAYVKYAVLEFECRLVVVRCPGELPTSSSASDATLIFPQPSGTSESAAPILVRQGTEYGC